MSADYRERAQREIERCAALCEREHGFAPIVHVQWDLRGLTGGQCQSKGTHCVLRFNATIAEAEGEAYAQTVAHEYAHAVVFFQRLKFTCVHGVPPRGPTWSPHGHRWGATMNLFGRPALRCHRYKSAERVVDRRSYVYRCRCSDNVRLSVVRHKRAQRGTTYRCGRCTAPLVFDRALA